MIQHLKQFVFLTSCLITLGFTTISAKPSAKPIEKITKYKDFKNEILNSKGNIVVKFTAEWCGPCKSAQPVLEKLATEFSSISFFAVSTKVKKAIQDFSINSIPMLVFFKGGKEVSGKRIRGFSTPATYKDQVRNTIKNIFNI